nr:unnamed protein product [Naegleria fowleri]
MRRRSIQWSSSSFGTSMKNKLPLSSQFVSCVVAILFMMMTIHSHEQDQFLVLAAVPPIHTLHERSAASQLPASFRHVVSNDNQLYNIVEPLLTDCLTSGKKLYEVTTATTSSPKSLYISCYDSTQHVPHFTLNLLSYAELNKPNADRPDQEPWFTLSSSDTITGKAYETPYDRGHLVPNNDFRSAEEKVLTFIVINRAPQLDTTNRGVWRHIEHSLRDIIIEEGANGVNSIKALVITRLLFKSALTSTFAKFKDSFTTSQVPISYNKVAIVFDKDSIREVLTMKADNTNIINNDQLPNIVKSWTSLSSTDPLKTNIHVTMVGTESTVTTKVDTKVKNFKAYVDQCSAMKKAKTAYFLISYETSSNKWKVQVKNFSPCNHLCSFTMNRYIFVQSFFERSAMTQYKMDLRLRTLFTDGLEEQKTKDFSFYLPQDLIVSEMSSMSTVEGIFTYTCEDKRKFAGAKHEFQNIGIRSTLKEQRLVSYGGVVAKKPRRRRGNNDTSRRKKKVNISASDLKDLLSQEYPPSTHSGTSATNVKFTFTTFTMDSLDHFTEPRGRRAERDRSSRRDSSSSSSPRSSVRGRYSAPSSPSPSRSRSRSRDRTPIVKKTSTLPLSGKSIASSSVKSSHVKSRSPSPIRHRSSSSSLRSPSPSKRYSKDISTKTSTKKDRSRSRDREKSTVRIAPNNSIGKSTINTKATPLPKKTTATVTNGSNTSNTGPSQLQTGPLVVKIEEHL